jgi:hypothetical protein
VHAVGRAVGEQPAVSRPARVDVLAAGRRALQRRRRKVRRRTHVVGLGVRRVTRPRGPVGGGDQQLRVVAVAVGHGELGPIAAQSRVRVPVVGSHAPLVRRVLEAEPPLRGVARVTVAGVELPRPHVHPEAHRAEHAVVADPLGLREQLRVLALGCRAGEVVRPRPGPVGPGVDPADVVLVVVPRGLDVEVVVEAPPVGRDARFVRAADAAGRGGAGGAHAGDRLVEVAAVTVEADELAVPQRTDDAVVGLRWRRVAAAGREPVALRSVRAREIEIALLGVDDRVRGCRGCAEPSGHRGDYEDGEESHRGRVPALRPAVVSPANDPPSSPMTI